MSDTKEDSSVTKNRRQSPKSLAAFFRRIDRRAEKAMNDAQSLLKLEKNNLLLAMACVISNIIVVFLVYNKDPASGYIPTTSDWTIEKISSLSSRDEITSQDVINFTSLATRQCLTFTYLQSNFEIRNCFKKYFSVSSEREFFGIIHEKFIDPSRSVRFDLNTSHYHTPAIINDQTTINGKAAWKVRVFLDLTFNTRANTKQVQKWEAAIVVVKAFKTLMPEGLEIHSATLRPAT